MAEGNDEDSWLECTISFCWNVGGMVIRHGGYCNARKFPPAEHKDQDSFEDSLKWSYPSDEATSA